jgi:hypothetical protein
MNLFMRHLAVARGCVAAATSASALLNESMLMHGSATLSGKAKWIEGLLS